MLLLICIALNALGWQDYILKQIMTADNEYFTLIKSHCQIISSAEKA